MFGRKAYLSLLLLLPTSCGPGPGPLYRPSFSSDDPGARILAIRAAADAKDASVVPLLVDRLEDEDEAVRMFAIMALDRITGERLGYDYVGPVHQRAASVDRWREYVRQQRHVKTATSKQPSRAGETAAPAAALPPDVD